MSDPTTARELADALQDLARSFMLSLDPGVKADLSSVRLDLTGPNLSMTYAQTGSEPPMLQLSLTGITNAAPLVSHEPAKWAEESEKRGWRR